MAKRNRENEENEEKKGGGLLTVFIILLIVAIWVAIFALLINLDVGGIGTTLRPMLKDIPIINKILPDVSDEQLAWENDLAYKDIVEANRRIKELEVLVDNLNIEKEDKDDEIAVLTAQVNRLRELERQMENFEQRVYEFDQKIVFGENAPSLEEYIKWYQTIAPENAERIYEMAIQKEAYNATIREKAAYYEKMKAASAAEVFENMTADLEYICKLLYCMKTQSVSDILSKMDPLFAARITRKMKDMDEARFEAWVLEN
ncbi:MAG: hypothetical protein J1E35_09405 [Lachnospiraceae bacterium]|nr:hypothetical protein [Lachnospiraceae bacterium]